MLVVGGHFRLLRRASYFSVSSKLEYLISLVLNSPRIVLLLIIVPSIAILKIIVAVYRYCRRFPEESCHNESGSPAAAARVGEDVYRACARAAVGKIVRRACLNLVNRPWRLAGVRWARTAAVCIHDAGLFICLPFGSLPPQRVWSLSYVHVLYCGD